ncbi:hypothetical protein WJX79_003195 [Trebouxia sp. C0005]
MIWDDAPDADWDEAVHAYCAAAEAGLFPQHSRLHLQPQPSYVSQSSAPVSQPPFNDIQHRARHFAQQMHLLPPLAPRHSRCPGVYSGQGCGAKLRWVQFREGGGCWGCSSWPACDYKEAATERLANPQVTLEAVSKDVFKVEAATGGEDVVRFCGGLTTVLAAAAIPLHKALSYQKQNLAGQEQHASAAELGADMGQRGQVLFSFVDYDDICRRLQSRHLQPSLLGSSALIPYATLTSLRGGGRRASESEAEERFSSMPYHLRQALMPFQRAGVQFALRREGRTLLADEMGVGKTVQAIAIASCYREEWPLLIIVPASMRLVWAEELEKWLPHLRPSSIHVIEGKSDRLQGADLPAVCITSYEMMQRLTCDACKGIDGRPVVLTACAGSQHCLASKGWKIIIADESHTLRTSEKPPDARHTEAAVSAVRRSHRAIFLTGTPSLSRPFDLFRQVDALRPGLLGKDRAAFSYRYCGRRLIPVGRHGSNTKKYDNTGLSRAGELHALLKEELMLRRLKRDVMAELPPKRRQVVRLPRPKPADWPSQEVPEDAEDSGSEAEQDERQSSSRLRGSEAMSKSHQTGLAKLPNGLEWLINALGAARRGSKGRVESQEEGAEPAPKFLIFAHHKDVMSKLANALEGGQGKEGWGGVPYVRIDGETDSRDRRTACLQFKEDPSIRAALLSITAAGTGLDFSAASAVVFVELPQEVALVRQAEDRAHRHGQKLSVNVYFLVAKGTSDEHRWQALSRSLERVTAVHGDEGDDQHGLKAGGGAVGKEADGCEAAQALTQAEVIEAQTAGQEKPSVWFEVSPHTSRLHFHAAKDGSDPFGLSLPMGALQGTGVSASLQELLQAVDTRSASSVHVGPVGVLALPAHVTRPVLEVMLSDAREFVAEWLEMRPVFQHRLFGQCLRPPLQEMIEEVQQQATAEGAFGRGTSRYLDPARPDVQLPTGAAWSTVKVRYARFVNPVEYQQAFTADNGRLCICCLSPVPACSAKKAAVLEGAMDLFCGADCEGKFCTRSSGGALRRALFRLERGVCTCCGLDCHALVNKVRMIERGSHKCDERRRARILTYAPTFGRHGSKAYLDRLVKQAVEGNAWHADHIVAVYQGGGLCDLENLRTLCVICHQDVTKQQAKERAVARRQVAGQGTLDRFLSPSQEKQAQKHLAKVSKMPAKVSKNRQDLDMFQQGTKQALPPAMSKQPHGTAQQLQGRVKRPRRQMTRLTVAQLSKGFTYFSANRPLSPLLHLLHRRTVAAWKQPCPAFSIRSAVAASLATDMSIPSGKTEQQVPLYPERHIRASAAIQDPLSWKGDLLAIGIHSDALTVKEGEATTINDSALQNLDKALDGVITEFIIAAEFTAKVGSSHTARVGGSARFISIVGLGKKDDASADADWGPSTYQKMGTAIGVAAKTHKAKTAAAFIVGSAPEPAAGRITQGAMLSAYEAVRFKKAQPKLTGGSWTSLEKLQVLLPEGGDVGRAQQSVNRSCAMAKGAIVTRYLVEAPPNICTPTHLANAAAKIAEGASDVMTLEVLEKEDCEKLQMGCYLAVAACSEEPLKFIHLTYKPKGPVKKKVALIGKGLTFDSGGYNLKVGGMIELMKFDMGGAGAVFGAAQIIADLKPEGVEIHFISASCENMIDGKGMLPGDVLTASNGKTVEVLNTDAEGRLTLADALVYAEKKCGAEAIIDVATLTGACMVALGTSMCGMFSPNQQLVSQLKQAGSKSGEKLWQLPLEDDYWENCKSPIADMTNIGGRFGGAITAALFLKEYVDSEKIPWAHLDIAGFGAQTLAEWAISKGQ